MRKLLLMFCLGTFVSFNLSAMGGKIGRDRDKSRDPAYETDPLLKKYSYVDPNRIVDTRAKKLALQYYDKKKNSVSNSKYLTVIDFTKHSKYRRLFVMNMQTGKVLAYHTAHGQNTDPNHDGYSDYFSNVPKSKKSSIGLYKVAETYYGKYGYSVRLDGLSRTNSNARRRAIVMHPANYVKAGYSKQGRSWGCPSLDPATSKSVINKIRGGSLMYAWGGE